MLLGKCQACGDGGENILDPAQEAPVEGQRAEHRLLPVDWL